MKSFFLAFVALTLAVDAAIALECYTCGFMEGAPTEEFEKMEGFDKSCKSGKKPKKDLNKACPANYTLCGKAVASAEIGDGKELEVTIRGCLSESQLGRFEAEKCHEGTGKDLNGLIAGIPESAKVTMCTCKEDKCNSSSMLKVTQGSLMVLVIGFLTSEFMY